MREVVIVSAVRTAIGKFGGGLTPLSAPQMGAIVIKDVPAGAVVVGRPARIIKMKDEKTEAKTALIDALRTLL